MKKHLSILSLFDGISCGQIALNKVIQDKYYYTWYSSEIDDGAIRITQHNYPDTIQIGDVRVLNKNMFPYPIDILMGGSPCQDLSIAGKRKGMKTIDNIEVTSLKQYIKLKNDGFQFIGQSHLFWEFVRLNKEIKPKYFILENVKMNEKWANIISEALGVDYVKINSSLVSAQNRLRYYWTNIPMSIPEDKGIMLSDIIPNAIGGYGKRSGWNKKTRTLLPMVGTTRKDGKSNTLVTKEGNTTKMMLSDGTISQIPIEVWEQLQTIPKGYTDIPGITLGQRKHGIGNGWTVDVITHILSSIPEFKKNKLILTHG